MSVVGSAGCRRGRRAAKAASSRSRSAVDEGDLARDALAVDGDRAARPEQPDAAVVQQHDVVGPGVGEHETGAGGVRVGGEERPRDGLRVGGELVVQRRPLEPARDLDRGGRQVEVDDGRLDAGRAPQDAAGGALLLGLVEQVELVQRPFPDRGQEGAGVRLREAARPAAGAAGRAGRGRRAATASMPGRRTLTATACPSSRARWTWASGVTATGASRSSASSTLRGALAPRLLQRLLDRLRAQRNGELLPARFAAATGSSRSGAGSASGATTPVAVRAAAARTSSLAAGRGRPRRACAARAGRRRSGRRRARTSAA